MIVTTTIVKLTRAPFQLIKITDEVRRIVSESGVKDGQVTIVSAHTTTGIIVNEGLECVETDMQETLERLIPRHAPYAHAHFLPSYGATGSNAPAHLKSMLTGYHCLFLIRDGKLLCGSAQDIYLAEYDGPQSRKVHIQVMGE